MAAIKHSKQREAIKELLKCRYDHPTADTVYMDLRQEYPNISLGTVYRNLSLLADLGEIQRINMGSGPERFDGNPLPHYHFICHSCGQVSDMEIDSLDIVKEIASQHFNGRIDGHTTYFYGLCPNCFHSKKS